MVKHLFPWLQSCWLNGCSLKPGHSPVRQDCGFKWPSPSPSGHRGPMVSAITSSGVQCYSLWFPHLQTIRLNSVFIKFSSHYPNWISYAFCQNPDCHTQFYRLLNGDISALPNCWDCQEKNHITCFLMKFENDKNLY